MLKLFKKDLFFFGAIFFLVLYFFRKAFQITFFQDDFFFLKISRAQTIQDFVKFFSPIRTYSYKPIASEVFYFFIHLLNENIILAHVFVFIVYFIGLYFLYQSLVYLTKNKLFSKISIGLYAINFIHLFQLYWFATFQEIAVLTFLSISFYYFLTQKYKASLPFFVLALFSKETAILFFPFLIFISFFFRKEKTKKKIYHLIPYGVLSLIFYFTYQYSLNYITGLSNYKPHYNPKFLLNNFSWYLLWGIGLPNFMPLYFTSLLKPPIPQFWNLFKIIEIKSYFIVFFIYLLIFIISLIIFSIKKPQKIKSILLFLFLSIFFFFLFIAPILIFTHKWMVRLTLPLIFISLFQGYILSIYIKNSSFFRNAAVLLIILYAISNYYGVKVHESSSLYFLETRFVNSAGKYFSQNKNKILKNKYLYFKNPPKGFSNPWGGSQKLKNTFSDQNFLDHFFPDSNLKAIYEFEDKKIPEKSFIVNSVDILLKQ